MSTAVILAGGKSRRMGCDKLGLTLLPGGTTLLESAVERFRQEFDEIYISVAEPSKKPEIDAPCIADIYPGMGPLAGLHAALTTVQDDGVFLVAADLPFSSPQAAKRLIELCGDADICVIQRADGLLEPLFGFYRKALSARCGELLGAGRQRMTDLLSVSDTRYAAPAELDGLWNPNMLLNVNFPADYENVLQIAINERTLLE